MNSNAAAAPVLSKKWTTVVALTLVVVTAPVHAQQTVRVERDTVERWLVELSNRGRWGPSDERGTLNLITPEHRRAAAGLVQQGRSISLSHNYEKERGTDTPSPLEHETRLFPSSTGMGAAQDRFNIYYHGGAHTHFDALCHVWYQQKMYNDTPVDSVTVAGGCARLGVTAAKDGIVSRGVLVDFARFKGRDYLEPGTAIYPADLEAWEKSTGITIRTGDVLIVRTGRWARRATAGPWDVTAAAAGVHASVAPWLRARGVAVLGSDYANEVLPSGIPGFRTPIHVLTVYAMGMPLLDNLDLEAVAAVAAEQRRWEFMFVAAPLAVVGATGSPINPIAIYWP